MLEIIQDVWRYVTQMIPLGLGALVILMLLRPIRKKRLREMNLVSSARRETALVLFVVFCAGLAALTLFPANLWGYVFDRLFRAEGGSGREVPGTGLGLSIAKRLAEEMGGTLSVSSEPFVETCFSLRLPLGAEGPRADERIS